MSTSRESFRNEMAGGDLRTANAVLGRQMLDTVPILFRAFRCSVFSGLAALAIATVQWRQPRLTPKWLLILTRVFFLAAALLANLFAINSASAVEIVQAEIKQKSAWTGQSVRMIVTLYSPGPFSGSASFSLPELPRTVILKEGNPVVGSETIGGESWFTQRHELIIYTQEAGQIVIPPFEVRFAGKQTFTSDPEPMQGKTLEQRFLSKRPPGTDQLDFVVAATNLQIGQAWVPAGQQSITAGDIIQRRVTRTAQGTAAMMLTPFQDSPVDGVRVFTTQPAVSDKSERGESTAQRIDVIKYQFQRAGSFTLPSWQSVWWDTKTEKLKSEQVPGIDITVTAPPGWADQTAAAIADGSDQSRWLQWSLLGAVVGGLGIALSLRVIPKWKSYQQLPETIARGKLRSACRENDAASAYAALIAWKRSMNCDSFTSTDLGKSLQSQSNRLASQLYAASTDTETWSGRELWKTFSCFRREMKRVKPMYSVLPRLNPTEQP